jgi:integrase/recombinase XerD
MKLLLEFASRRHKKNCTDLTLEDLSAETVRRFLDNLEQARHNSVATRNVRLPAIHSFFQYLATTDPRYLVHCQSILVVPFKRRPHRVPEYLERSEIQSLFLQIDCQTPLGQRDDALLRLLYNTGMRAQELVDLDVNHLRFSRQRAFLNETSDDASSYSSGAAGNDSNLIVKP